MTTGDPVLDFVLSWRSSSLTPIMKGISAANSEYAYLALIPIVYWILSRRIGFVLLVADAAGTFAAVALKTSLGLPRPPNAGESAWLATADGAGFPSGHTTAAATTWGALAGITKAKRLFLLGALVTASVAVSRLYLGVHYTIDVVGGAAIGIILGALLFFGLPKIEAMIGRLPFARRFLFLVFFPLFALLNSTTDALVILSATGGAAFGEILADRLNWKVRTGHPRDLPLFGVARLVFGLPVLGLLALGLGDPTEAGAAEIIVRFTALGIFVTLLGPRLFLAIESRLARSSTIPPVT